MKKTVLITALLMTAPSLALAQGVQPYIPRLPSSPMNGTPVYRPPVLPQPDNSWADRMQAEREASRQADIQRQLEAQRIQESRRQDQQRQFDTFRAQPGIKF